MVEVIHRVLAYIAVAAAVVGIVWSTVLAIRPATRRQLFDRFGLIVVGLLAAAALAGIAQLAAGARPREDLHLIYAAIVIGLIPLARSFVQGKTRREAVVLVAAYLALAGVLFRLFTTG